MAANSTYRSFKFFLSAHESIEIRSIVPLPSVITSIFFMSQTIVLYKVKVLTPTWDFGFTAEGQNVVHGRNGSVPIHHKQTAPGYFLLVLFDLPGENDFHPTPPVGYCLVSSVLTTIDDAISSSF